MTGKAKDLLVDVKRNIKECMRIIDHAGLGVAFVTDKDGKLIGSITDGDIRRALLQGKAVSDGVKDVMNTDPFYISQGYTKSEILDFIKSKKVKERITVDRFKLPVVDTNHNVVDILTIKGNKFNSINTKGAESSEVKTPKHVLVIGGGGYIGSTLTRMLLENGYVVTVLDAFLYGKKSLEEIKNHRNIRIIEGDTRHIENLTEAMDGVDAVVHLAELVGDPACALSPEETMQINFFATQLVAMMCKRLQINRLIYMSSCSVYGASESEELLTENAVLNPVSLYARMKIDSEEVLREMSDENFQPTILRLATVYGHSFRPRFDLVVNLLTAKAATENVITIFGGSQWRPNVHVRDVSRAIMKVLEAPLEKVGGEVFNVGSLEQNHTITELGEKIKRFLPKAKLTVTDAEDNRNYKVDFSKIKEILNFLPSRSVEEGVTEVHKFVVNENVDYRETIYSNIRFLEQINNKK